MNFSEPIKIDKQIILGETLWLATLDFRCPVCKKVFESTSSASNAIDAIIFAGQIDENGYYELICSGKCLDKEN